MSITVARRLTSVPLALLRSRLFGVDRSRWVDLCWVMDAEDSSQMSSSGKARLSMAT